MIKAIVGFAAGFAAAKIVSEPECVKKFASVFKEKAGKLKSATQKAAAAARDEFRGEGVAPEEEVKADT